MTMLTNNPTMTTALEQFARRRLHAQQIEKFDNADLPAGSPSGKALSRGLVSFTNGPVKVIHGANDGVFDVAGHDVVTVVRTLVDVFNIPSEAIAFVNGEHVDAGYMLHAHDTLEFCKQAGRKEGRKMFTKPDLLREYTGYPADVMAELFATLRHNDVAPDGQPTWHESSVDEWLDERYSRKRADDERDKVIPPSSVRLSGQVYDGFTRNEWRLLEAIVNKTGVEVDDVIEHVYGHDADNKGKALTQVIKRLNKKLLDKLCRFIVGEENGFVAIRG